MESVSSLLDIDREILLKMTDEEILKNCSLNKYYSTKVCDDKFFHKVIIVKYPHLLEDKIENVSWKQYYLKTLYYISRIKESGYDYVNYVPVKPTDVLDMLEIPDIQSVWNYRLVIVKLGRVNPVNFDILLKLAYDSGKLKSWFVDFNHVIGDCIIRSIITDNFLLFKYLSNKYPEIKTFSQNERQPAWMSAINQYKGKNPEFIEMLEIK